MNILAFETSCDETSAAIIQDGRRILTNVVASQIDLHKRWGGVVPELASRQHILYIVPTLEAALKEANLTWRDIDAIAVTNGPGLAGALLVGVNVAKGLAFALGKPLLPVNHLEGHIYANWLIPNNAAKPKPVITELPASADTQETDSNSEPSPSRQYRAAYEQSAPVYRPAGAPAPKPAPPIQPPPKNGEGVTVPPEPQFPIVALVVSGGHTELILMRGHGLYELLGKTIDDAAGEAFDKVGRILGLGYPGGPAIQKLVDAEHADPRKIDLPRAWLRGTYDFSFSGLKTAVMRKIDEYGGLPAVDKPRPFAEVEAAQQRSDAAQHEATSDSNSIRPGQSPTAMVREPLAMPAPADQPPSQPQARGFQPPARLTRLSEPTAQPTVPPAPPTPSAAPAPTTRPANPPRATTPPPAPVVEADDDEDEDEATPEPSFRLAPQPPRDRLASLFVRDAEETAEDEDDEDDEDDDDNNVNNDKGNVQPPVSAAPSGSALERRPLLATPNEPRPRAIYSMFDDEDDVATTSPLQAANPPRSTTNAPASTPNPTPRPAVAGPGLERRPLRTVPTPDPRAVPQLATDDEDEDEDEQPLPRTLSPQARPLQPPADQRSQPQPPANRSNPPAPQRSNQPTTPPPASVAPQSGSVYPRSTVLGSEPASQRPSQQTPQQRPTTPPTQRPTQPSQQRPNQPAPQRPTQPSTQQRSNQPPAQPPTAATPPQSATNRPRPLPPSQPQRGTYARPGQLPQRPPTPLAQREIIPVPKGSSTDDDDRDERDYIDDEEDDMPRSRVGSAADDDDEPGDENRPRRNRSLGADAPRPQGVRGSVGGGDNAGKKGHAPVALIAAAFQLAVVEVLVEKTAAAAEQYGAKQVLIAGGVAANRLLREMMGERLNVPLVYPPMALCTDNAAMIGAAAYYRYYHAEGAARDRADTSDWGMDIAPNAHFLGEV